MKFNHLGILSVSNPLVVTDPCYDLEESPDLGKKLNVKKGDYNCFSLTGRLVDPLFGVDELEDYFRVAELIIIHEDHSTKKTNPDKLSWKRSSKSFCIDSGQAGFFDCKKYQKELEDEKPLTDKAYSFMREHILSSKMKIKQNLISLEKKEEDGVYKIMLEFDKGDRKKTEEFFNREIDSAKMSIERFNKHLAEKSLPSYLKVDHSKDFYENICSLSCSEFGAGILNDVGVVSQSGLGDMGMTLYTAKDSENKIIACKVVFIKRKEIK